MTCDKQHYCDGYPEQCTSCPNMQTPSNGNILNVVNINISGGVLSHIVALTIALASFTYGMNRGTGTVHHIAGAILPNRSSLYYTSDMGQESENRT